MAAVGDVIDRGRFILGDEVAEFEQRFAELCGVRYAVGVNSGSDALILALKSLGVGHGDEVITVPSSFVSSVGCIALLGACPVFVDAGEDYNIDPALIEPSRRVPGQYCRCTSPVGQPIWTLSWRLRATMTSTLSKMPRRRFAPNTRGGGSAPSAPGLFQPPPAEDPERLRRRWRADDR